MKALLDRAGARAFDRRAMDAGVPGVILMENAGRGAADAIVERFGSVLERVVVVGGSGQNGGDAWVVARRLRTLGYSPQAFLAGARASVQGDAAINLAALDGVGPPAIELDGTNLGLLDEALADASLVVEGLFGTGLDRPITGWRADLVRRLDACRAPLVALDLPSGIDSDTGQVLGVSLRAALTVTFAASKRGLWQHPGRAHAGEIVCADIGVPPPCDGGLLELTDAARWLPERSWHAHKGTAGHVLVVAGSPGAAGAAVLTGLGALRGGAGRVTLAAREGARAALDHKVLELMTEALPGEGAGEAALRIADGKAAAAVGPGLGLDEAGRALAVELAVCLPIPAVLDADALTAVSQVGLERLRGAVGPRVLTPHPGEAARLLGLSTEAVNHDRYSAAREMAGRSGQVVALKGAGTVIAAPDGRLAVCPLGTPALGVAGTGDVLSGVVAAALPSAPGAFEATCAAVLLHARAGELAAATDRGLLAHEVAEAIPRALLDARGRSRTPTTACRPRPDG